jgi:hypothetical protein
VNSFQHKLEFVPLELSNSMIETFDNDDVAKFGTSRPCPCGMNGTVRKHSIICFICGVIPHSTCCYEVPSFLEEYPCLLKCQPTVTIESGAVLRLPSPTLVLCKDCIQSTHYLPGKDCAMNHTPLEFPCRNQWLPIMDTHSCVTCKRVVHAECCFYYQALNKPLNDKSLFTSRFPLAQVVPVCVACFKSHSVDETSKAALFDKESQEHVEAPILEFPFPISVQAFSDRVKQLVANDADGVIVSSLVPCDSKFLSKELKASPCIHGDDYHNLCDVGVSSLNPLCPTQVGIKELLDVKTSTQIVTPNVIDYFLKVVNHQNMATSNYCKLKKRNMYNSPVVVFPSSFMNSVMAIHRRGGWFDLWRWTQSNVCQWLTSFGRSKLWVIPFLLPKVNEWCLAVLHDPEQYDGDDSPGWGAIMSTTQGCHLSECSGRFMTTLFHLLLNAVQNGYQQDLKASTNDYTNWVFPINQATYPITFHQVMATDEVLAMQRPTHLLCVLASAVIQQYTTALTLNSEECLGIFDRICAEDSLRTTAMMRRLPFLLVNLASILQTTWIGDFYFKKATVFLKLALDVGRGNDDAPIAEKKRRLAMYLHDAKWIVSYSTKHFSETLSKKFSSHRKLLVDFVTTTVYAMFVHSYDNCTNGMNEFTQQRCKKCSACNIFPSYRQTIYFPGAKAVEAWRQVFSFDRNSLTKHLENEYLSWKNSVTSSNLKAAGADAFLSLLFPQKVPKIATVAIIDKKCYWEWDLLQSLMVSITHQFHPERCLVMQYDPNTFVKDNDEVDLSSADHIVCLVHHKSHFGVFVVDLRYNVIVVYDGKDIRTARQQRPTLPTNKSNSKALKKGGGASFWKKPAEFFVASIIDADATIDSTSCFSENLLKKRQETKVWLLMGCMMVDEPITVIPKESMISQDDAYDCGPIAIRHIIHIFHQLTKKFAVPNFPDRVELLHHYCRIMGPIWIEECVDWISGKGDAEAKSIIDYFKANQQLPGQHSIMQSLSSQTETLSICERNVPQLNFSELVGVPTANATDGTTSSTKPFVGLQVAPLSSDTKPPVSMEPSKHSTTEPLTSPEQERENIVPENSVTITSPEHPSKPRLKKKETNKNEASTKPSAGDPTRGRIPTNLALMYGMEQKLDQAWGDEYARFPPVAGVPYETVENFSTDKLLFFGVPGLQFPQDGQIGVNDYSLRGGSIADVDRRHVYHLRDDENNRLWYNTKTIDFYLQW